MHMQANMYQEFKNNNNEAIQSTPWVTAFGAYVIN